MSAAAGTEGLLFFFLPMALFFVFAWCYPSRAGERADEALRAPVVLPHFPYAPPRGTAAAGASSEPAACAICLDELRQGQLCSEVPACRHIFHESCIRAWAKKNNSCPLCRARIVLEGTGADDMV